MKTLVLCCSILVSPSFAQTPVTPASPPQNLKDDFAKSALRTLRTVESEPGIPRRDEDGRVLYPRVPVQAINDLDVDAQTKEEQAVVKTLNTFFTARMTNNLIISLLSIDARAYAHFHQLSEDRVILDAVTKSPTVMAIHSKEAACSENLEATLRSRIYQDAPVCSSEALAVPMPDTLDIYGFQIKETRQK